MSDFKSHILYAPELCLLLNILFLLSEMSRSSSSSSSSFTEPKHSRTCLSRPAKDAKYYLLCMREKGQGGMVILRAQSSHSLHWGSFQLQSASVYLVYNNNQKEWYHILIGLCYPSPSIPPSPPKCCTVAIILDWNSLSSSSPFHLLLRSSSSDQGRFLALLLEWGLCSLFRVAEVWWR